MRAPFASGHSLVASSSSTRGVGSRDDGAPVTLQASHAPTHPAYRPDIDGLRAVAVLAVVGFHAFPGSVKGGFVGVDIFFVISGFLISTILFGNLARGTFDLRDFYARRVRRIFPALLAVMAATFVFGWFALMADEYEQLGKHLAAGAGFVSNLVSWRESGYFDTAAEAKPFLHLWSLGVEEQFYIVWPLMLLATWRWRLNPLVVTSVALLASFALNVQLAVTDRVADFYSPLTRFWELSAGSLLAWLSVSDTAWTRRLSPGRRDVLSLVGATLLIGALLLIRSSDAFPGWWALLPTAGAVLLISAGSTAWVNRHVLSHRAMVAVGLVSYPLYLWHWPILSLIHIVAAERPSRGARIVALVAALTLAWLTWRFIELPLRKQRKPWIPAALVGLMIVVGLAGFASFRNGGFASRAAADLPVVVAGDLGQEAYSKYGSEHFVLCEPAALRREAEQWDGAIRCLQSRDGPPDLALVGDSHAEHLFPGLAEALPKRNVVYYLRSSSPVTTNAAYDPIFSTVIADPHIRTVVLAAWWGLRLDEAGGANEAALEHTIASLQRAGKAVYLVDDTPNFSFSPRLCKYAGSLLRVHRCSEDAAFFGKEMRSYADLLARLEHRFPTLTIIRLAPAFCDAAICSMTADGKLLFRDSDHLSVAGSQFVGRDIVVAHPELQQ